MHTLWLSKDTLLDTRLQRAVEQRVEHSIGSVDLIVRLDIFLESNTAARMLVHAHVNKFDASIATRNSIAGSGWFVP